MILRRTFRQFSQRATNMLGARLRRQSLLRMLDTCDLTVAAPKKNSSEI